MVRRMDDELWQAAGLGPANETGGGPADRRRRLDARSHVGAQVRIWRRTHGLRQEQAHARLGLSGQPSRMHLLENGEAPWTRDDVAAVAAALGMDTEEIVRQSMQASGQTPPDRRQEFVRWARGLSDDEWQDVVDEVERAG